MTMIKKSTSILLFVLSIILCMNNFSTSTTPSAGSLSNEKPHARHISWWPLPPWWRNRLPPPQPPHSPVHKPPHKPRGHPSGPPSGRHAPPRHSKIKTPPHHHPSPPGFVRDPRDCSTALVDVDGCVKDLITSFFEETTWVGGQCCRAISGISDDCFREAFTQFEAPDFMRRIRSFCAHDQH